MAGNMGKEEPKPALGRLVYKAKADNTDASKRMHDYLASQQRKKEEHWMKKYGKVLESPKKDLIKAERSANSRLPPINARQGQPPMFAADGPIGSFPHAVVSKDKRHNANIPYHPALPNAPLLPQLATLAEGSETNTPRLPSQPSAVSQQASQATFGKVQHGLFQSQLASHSSALLQTENSKMSGLPNTKSASYIPAVSSENSGAFSQGFRAGPMPRHGAHMNAASLGGDSGSYASLGSQIHSHPSKPARDLQLELNVVKSIKSREDTLDRLKVACEKLGAMFGGVAPQILPSSEPMTRLMYRLVAQLRARTLDCIETLAAWHKRSGSAEHFMYYGTPYMKNIGPDLAFLDQQPFLRARLQGCHAVDDPFLMQVTSDGIPIEEATVADLRRGAHRFSADALRIRVARKILQTYCHHSQQPYQARLGETSPLPTGPGVDGLDSFDSSSLSSMHDEEGTRFAAVEIPQPTDTSNDTGISHGLIQQPLVTVVEEDTQETRLQCEPSNSVAEDVITAVDEDGDNELDSPAAETSQELQAGLQQEHGQCMSDNISNTEHPELVQRQQQPTMDADTTGIASHTLVVESQPMLSFHEQPQHAGHTSDQTDDGAYIDYALDAIVASLEGPYVDQFASQQFTVAGWQIDHQLAEMVDDLGPGTCQSIMDFEHQQEPLREGCIDSQVEQRGEPAQAATEHNDTTVDESGGNGDELCSVSKVALQQHCYDNALGEAEKASKPIEIHIHVGRNEVGRVLARLTSAPSSATECNLRGTLGHRPTTAQVRLPIQINQLCSSQQLLDVQGEEASSTPGQYEQAIEMVIDVERSLLSARPSEDNPGPSQPNQSALVGISLALPSQTGPATDTSNKPINRSVSLAVRLQSAANQLQGGSRSFHAAGASSRTRADRLRLLLELGPGAPLAASHAEQQPFRLSDHDTQQLYNASGQESEVAWVNLQLSVQENGELAAAVMPHECAAPGTHQPRQQGVDNEEHNMEAALRLKLRLDGENILTQFSTPVASNAVSAISTEQAIESILEDLVTSVCL